MMEKTKEQLLLSKLRKVSRKARMGGFPGPHPGMPPMGRPHGPRGMPPMGGHGPEGMPPMGGHGPEGMPPMGGHGPEGMPPMGRRRGFGGMIPPREMLLLTVLDFGEAGARQKDVAEELGINASSLSEQIDRLEAEGYLRRQVNPEDKRSTLLALTELGQARAFEVQDERRRQAEKFCEKLTEAEKDTMLALLDKLLED